MKQVLLNIPDHKYSFFMKLMDELGIESVRSAQHDALQGLEQGVKELKLVQEGKLTARPAQDFLNE